jgi:WD40 repeat protein
MRKALCILSALLLLGVGLASRLLCSASNVDLPEQPSGKRDRLDLYGDALPAYAVARIGTVRFQHHGHVLSLSYSPDGKILASSGYDGIYLWDPSSGRLLQHWSKRPAFCRLAFSSDGRRLWLQSSDDGAIFVWDFTTNPTKGPRPSLNFPDNQGRAFAVSPNGKLAALGCTKGIRLWDAEQEKPLLVLEGAFSDNAVVFTPDGKHAATGGGRGEILLWDTASGKVARRFKPQRAENEEFGGRFGEKIGPIGISADGTTLAGLQYPNYQVVLWDLGTAMEQRRISLPVSTHSFGSFTDAALSPDGTRVAVTYPGFMHVFDASNGKLLGEVSKLGNIYTVVFSPDSKTVAGGTFSAVRQWEANTSRELSPIGEHQNSLGHVQLLPDGQAVCTASKTVRYWQAANGCELIGKETQFPAILGLAANGTTAVCQGKTDTQLEIWDVHKGVKVCEIAAPQKWPQCALSPDGKKLAVSKFVQHQPPSQDRDTFLQLWDAAAGNSLGEFKVHATSMWSFAFSPDGAMVVTQGGQDHNVRVWDFATQKLLHEFKSPEFGYHLQFTPDSKVLAAAGGRPLVLVRWDLATGKELPKMPGNELVRKHESGHIFLRFLRDGETLLTGNVDGNVFAWQLTTGKLLCEWKAHGSVIQGLQLSDDDRMLLTHALSTQELLLWDLKALLKR